MKKNPPSKPRITTILFDMGEKVTINAVQVGISGQIKLIGTGGMEIKPVKVTLKRSYERPKGEKILSSITVRGENIVSDVDMAILGHQVIAVIDANTREIRGQKITVAAVLRARPVGGGRMQQWISCALEFRNVDCNADLLAIKVLCNEIEKQSGCGPINLVSFVIDSDLNMLEKYRDRISPIIDNWFLPSWASLEYASDSAADSFFNTMLREADSISNQILDVIENGKLEDQAEAHPIPHSEYFRILTLQPKK